jgi:hypothetical protein
MKPKGFPDNRERLALRYLHQSRVAWVVGSVLPQSLMALIRCQYVSLARTLRDLHRGSWHHGLDRLSSYRIEPRHQHAVSSYVQTWLFLLIPVFDCAFAHCTMHNDLT